RARAAFLPLARGGARRGAAPEGARREHAPHGRGLLQGRRAGTSPGARAARRHAADDEGADLMRDVVIIGGCGANLASLKFALERLGVNAPVTEEPARAAVASHLILPGVGAAAPAMARLAATGFAE